MYVWPKHERAYLSILACSNWAMISLRSILIVAFSYIEIHQNFYSIFQLIYQYNFEI